MTNSNDFRTQTTVLLIIAWLMIAEYKQSFEALAALEKFFLQKYSATSQTSYLVQISLTFSLIWCKNRSALIVE